MKQFSYRITDEMGIHARPAGMLAKQAMDCSSFGITITITKGNETAAAEQPLEVIALGIKKGDEILVTVEGGNEEEVIKVLRSFFEENL